MAKKTKEEKILDKIINKFDKIVSKYENEKIDEINDEKLISRPTKFIEIKNLVPKLRQELEDCKNEYELSKTVDANADETIDKLCEEFQTLVDNYESNIKS